MTATLRDFCLVHAAMVEGDALGDLGPRLLGVGKVAAAVSLQAELLRQRPAGVLLFGVCGAYPARHRPGADLRIGDLVVVERDDFGDEGAITTAGFRPLRELGLPAIGPFAAAAALARAVANRLDAPLVAATTVSTCSGTEESSRAIAQRTGAAIETMEGAAVAHVCDRLQVPWLQVRAVSNWTGDRALAGWDLAGAAARVQAAVRSLLGA